MLAVAALSARAIVDAAALDGLRTVALDLFGDVDTRRRAHEWRCIGDAATLRIDDDRLLAALDALARRGEVRGWIAGSGFDGRADLLERGAACLPLVGTAPEDVRRVRDPQAFFDLLRSHGIGHPATAFEPPLSTAGWLCKDAGGSGGWQVRRAQAGDPPAAGCYWQRERSGVPMSATLVCNGRDAVLLGFNRQLTQAIGERPHVFRGVIGPLPVSDRVQRELTAIARLLAGVFRVRGLASLDFLLDGDTVEVLELNPRPPASLSLYPRVGDGGPLRAHLRACEQGELPSAPAAGGLVRGVAIVFAPHELGVDAACAARIEGCDGTHDLPQPGTRVAAGDPLCSLDAEGRDEADTTRQLAQRRAALQATLETRT
ncbi:ATP-grasp domain-containing protein [Variovorax sp. YR752]|uniref:ATP-grasp domain-containing protein n=1 Tax=Variovorax sp. YR752 TaxID=1884383 RepID=UPI003137EBB5